MKHFVSGSGFAVGIKLSVAGPGNFMYDTINFMMEESGDIYVIIAHITCMCVGR